jgi:hypothetical protein
MEGELGEGLTKSNRIKELLTILQWPGIKQDQDEKPTRYMEIERPSKNSKSGKINEYKNRNTLPSPLKVFGKWSK